jgi:hypothetical protein
MRLIQLVVGAIDLTLPTISSATDPSSYRVMAMFFMSRSTPKERHVCCGKWFQHSPHDHLSMYALTHDHIRSVNTGSHQSSSVIRQIWRCHTRWATARSIRPCQYDCNESVARYSLCITMNRSARGKSRRCTGHESSVG